MGADRKKKDLNIRVDYLTRVEGHGTIVVDMKQGRLETCRLNVVESPRFFEALLRGRSLFEAQHITSRICGICACGHSLASIQAGEDALGIIPSAQTVRLRRLLLHLEILDSHILHIYLLALPDLVGARSFMPLLGSHNKVVRRALKMKKVCNDAMEVLVGRHVHPISLVVGGFTKLPKPQDLDAMHEMLAGLRTDMDATVELLSTLHFPDFERNREYVGLVSDDGSYPLLSGNIGSTDGVRMKKQEYRKATNEFIVPHSTAKHAKLSRESYTVGPLARFNLNHAKLHPKASVAASALNLKPVCSNPFLNTLAQVVECVHCLEDAIAVIEDLQRTGVDQQERIVVGVNERGTLPVKSGEGIGAMEVPRGLLFHHYTVDDSGAITQANCVVPTNENLGSIEQDMRALVPTLLHKSQEEITSTLEMLVRAYDPCISCSTHLLDVRFLKS